MFPDILLDAFLDSIKMLPFLFAAYWVIEYIERSHGSRIEGILARGGRYGFIAGGILGCLPQCGFSAMAANFYASRVISLGTLMAVFVATSDEAVPLLISQPEFWPQLIALLGLKILFALAAGILFDFLLAEILPGSLKGGYHGNAGDVDCYEKHEEESGVLASALRHTAEVFAFIFLFNFFMGAVIAYVGEDSVAELLLSVGVFKPFAASLIGLVPNCASSVFIVQLFCAGALPFSSAAAGLCSGAGVGLAVLFRNNRSFKQNLFITGLLWLFGSCVGLFLQFFGV